MQGGRQSGQSRADHDDVIGSARNGRTVRHAARNTLFDHPDNTTRRLKARAGAGTVPVASLTSQIRSAADAM
jgi:hypothetical protein